ncbi:hypothetical protein K469DRAFT_683920 [Zopfia rhizophila CBS 207.26]|uniref:Uncharacterized protein n=1 Tax=Zopfia rhizophila CBS 207.26 TaxID=1314779 RepID=A0A6A6DBE4_9PEZI|nr:hypothetical protein K469DRAFT_683920 [Zopfia rhizophila CBS 207.26]
METEGVVYELLGERNTLRSEERIFGSASTACIVRPRNSEAEFGLGRSEPAQEEIPSPSSSRYSDSGKSSEQNDGLPQEDSIIAEDSTSLKIGKEIYHANTKYIGVDEQCNIATSDVTPERMELVKKVVPLLPQERIDDSWVSFNGWDFVELGENEESDDDKKQRDWEYIGRDYAYELIETPSLASTCMECIENEYEGGIGDELESVVVEMTEVTDPHVSANQTATTYTFFKALFLNQHLFNRFKMPSKPTTDRREYPEHIVHGIWVLSCLRYGTKKIQKTYPLPISSIKSILKRLRKNKEEP